MFNKTKYVFFIKKCILYHVFTNRVLLGEPFQINYLKNKKTFYEFVHSYKDLKVLKKNDKFKKKIYENKNKRR